MMGQLSVTRLAGESPPELITDVCRSIGLLASVWQ
jgi:hypothetical protein